MQDDLFFDPEDLDPDDVAAEVQESGLTGMTGDRTLVKMTELLRQDIPDRLISLKETKANSGDYIPYLTWTVVTSFLDFMAPGWEWSLQDPVLHLTGLDSVGYVVQRGTLTLVHSGGRTPRDGQGNAVLVTSQALEGKRSYGDPYSNAESMAIRRAAVKFGLGRRLYDKAYVQELVARLVQARGLGRKRPEQPRPQQSNWGRGRPARSGGGYSR